MTSTVPPDYRPTEKEPFMNEVMLEYFRQKLVSWKNGLLRDADQTLQNLQEQESKSADQSDRATAESDRSIELRTRDRARKLVQKIDEALQRVETGSFGYCSETGDPIGIKRLEARPIATLGIEAQERHERREKTQRDQLA
ncbi:MAG: RNA polymerase-binding protein DksA [Pelagibacteraceae bacterium]|nr:RNA polymerase-binding protein DksA [Pelagibacteraceae bacterium]PPR10072.1 MAG: RNA polymerase-binding transcription factor DksA [Alphaproteobacteria bacterium MarineAlpha11_Bin1]|tara:strand:- start:1938 stop:2360 length:423 start_codon:yes stop_codon:yes gene_type:complete